MGKIIEKVRKQRNVAWNNRKERVMWESLQRRFERPAMLVRFVEPEPAKPAPWWRFWA